MSIELKKCEQCGKEFKPQKATAQFCSHGCRAASTKRVNICVVCGKEFSKRSKTCSRECSQTLRNQSESLKTKICEMCGKEYHSTSSTSKFCGNPHYQKCEVCGKDFEINMNVKVVRTCSSLCAGKLINSKDSMEKRRETSRKNWGTNWPIQSREVQQRVIETNMERYGAEHALKIESGMNKQRATNRERYGTDYAIQNKDVKAKAEQTNLERYGVTNPFLSPEVQKQAADKKRELALAGKIKYPRISKLNRNLAEILKKELDTDVQLEKSLGNFCTDFYLPEKKIYLDYHPTVSHNLDRSFYCVINNCPQPCPEHPPIDKNYHYLRAKTAFDNDVTLIQWFQFDDVLKMLQLLKGKTGRDFKKLSARKLSVEKLSQPIANGFLRDTHVQGAGREQIACYGLVKDNSLVAVATFGKARFGNQAQWEFIRYAVAPNTIVHGGSGRLFQRFLEDKEPQSVVSYLDFNHTTKPQTFLNSMGFMEDKNTGPGIVWHNVMDDKRILDNSVRSVGADTLLGTDYGSRESSGFNNDDILRLEGYIPVPTAGNRVFTWRQ